MTIEINPILSEAQAVKAAKKCGKCKEECKRGCPVNIRIPEFVRSIKNNDLEKAADIMYGDNPFPCITGRLCVAKCEQECPRGVPIRSLERFVGDNFLPQLKKRAKIKRTAAIVGMGVTGLVVANHLIENGVSVEMFEVTNKPGGFLAANVPGFRLPAGVLTAELERVVPNVKVHFDSMVGTLHPLEELSSSFDAVILATGASKPVFGVEGEHLKNVFAPKEFLEADTSNFTDAVIIGCTDYAIESALIARQRGAKAMIIHDDELESLDVNSELLKSALSQGVQFMLLTKPLRLHGNGSVTSLECKQMRLAEHEGGLKEIIPIEDSEFHTECDHAIIAKGYEAHPAIAIHTNLRQSGKQRLWTNSAGQTTIKNVFAAGSVVLGHKRIDEVVAHSKKVAGQVMDFLKS